MNIARLSHDFLGQSLIWLKGILIIIPIISFQPAQAFIPYVYEPNPKNLNNTGINIGKTAAQLLQIGQPKEAERLALIAVKLKPNDFRLWSVLAEAQLKLSQFEKAKKSLQKAKQLNPKQASLWFAEATLLLQEKKINEAISSINNGLILDPNNAGAYFQLGNAKVMQNKLKIAIKYFQKAATLRPNFWEALNNQGLMLFELNKHKEAINIWEKVLKIEKNAEPMLALAATIHLLEPKNISAIDLAIEALQKNPNYVSSKFQKEQLWGIKLRKATKKLFSKPALRSSVERALANSNLKNE